MKFGIREICDVVLRAKATQKIGNKIFFKNEPVCYFDTLKTSSFEGASTTVYATGGRGNSRLISWDGERTVTFTMEDALISPIGLSILTGAGLTEATEENGIVTHVTETVTPAGYDPNGMPILYVSEEPYIKQGEASIYVMGLNENGEVVTEPFYYYSQATFEDKYVLQMATATEISGYSSEQNNPDESLALRNLPALLVDYYTKRTTDVFSINISPDQFGGNFYLEGSTLWRDQGTGKDLPAEFIIPNCRVQSNFTFSMSSSGDPSTFTFTLDAFPDYTRWNTTEKVLATIQVIGSNLNLLQDEKRSRTWETVQDVIQEDSSYTYGYNLSLDKYRYNFHPVSELSHSGTTWDDNILDITLYLKTPEASSTDGSAYRKNIYNLDSTINLIVKERHSEIIGDTSSDLVTLLPSSYDEDRKKDKNYITVTIKNLNPALRYTFYVQLVSEDGTIMGEPFYDFILAPLEIGVTDVPLTLNHYTIQTKEKIVTNYSDLTDKYRYYPDVRLSRSPDITNIDPQKLEIRIVPQLGIDDNKYPREMGIFNKLTLKCKYSPDGTVTKANEDQVVEQVIKTWDYYDLLSNYQKNKNVYFQPNITTWQTYTLPASEEGEEPTVLKFVSATVIVENEKYVFSTREMTVRDAKAFGTGLKKGSTTEYSQTTGTFNFENVTQKD